MKGITVKLYSRNEIEALMDKQTCPICGQLIAPSGITVLRDGQEDEICVYCYFDNQSRMVYVPPFDSDGPDYDCE